MNMNIEQLKDWRDSARRGLEYEIDRLKEKEVQLSDYLRALDATEDLLEEIDVLKDELERQKAENDSLDEELAQRQAENERLRAELLEMKEQRLAQEPAATATEIHNHFESGSSAQVFNDKVTGRFAKKKRWKRKTR
jgi:chromosome segregation ATPase